MARSAFTIEGYNAVLAALKATNGAALDDHKAEGTTLQLAGVAALVKGEKIIPVALCNSRYFSVNLMYVEDGKAHIDRSSVGGAVMPMEHNMDVLEAVKAYNQAQADFPFSSGQLEHIFMFNTDKGVDVKVIPDVENQPDVIVNKCSAFQREPLGELLPDGFTRMSPRNPTLDQARNNVSMKPITPPTGSLE